MQLVGAPKPKEGMWIPLLIDQLNMDEMHEMGCRLSAEDIYSINHGSLKDAIVSFGGFCTASVISSKGLLLTNHHCGYRSIQKHSTLENNYLANGFWAGSYEEELPNPGLFVTFIREIRDVTSEVLSGITGQETEEERQHIISRNSRALEKEALAGTGYGAFVRPFYKGNEFYLFITETFRDIRLVGAPPEGIGKFGGDTDNWMWPRHNADFSLFRIYANKDNQPADYSPDNVPWEPDYFLPVATDGIHEGDFTMVFGFPGRTEEYLTSYGVQLILEQTDPVRIDLRTKRLAVMQKAMDADPKIALQYAAKQSSVSNGWKKWQGEVMGLKRTHAIDRKHQQEEAFRQWAAGSGRESWQDLPGQFASAYRELAPFALNREYVNEAAFGVELISFAWRLKPMIDDAADPGIDDETFTASLRKYLNTAKRFYKDYEPTVDKAVFPLLLNTWYHAVDTDMLPELMRLVGRKFGGDFTRYADYIYGNTALTDSMRVMGLLRSGNRRRIARLAKDPAVQLMQNILDNYHEKVAPQYSHWRGVIDSLQRIYMEALRQMPSERYRYPDANGTMRIAYGFVEPYYPKDGVFYYPFTTLKGVMEKSRIPNPEYEVPEKLKTLWENRDFGRWADADGTMHVCFIASNHTTGGNSGSPVINAWGQLVGLNFDRNWEGTMSDINYDISLCRNISVDIRYIMFIIDKYAGAQHLLEEIRFVQRPPED